LAQASVLVPALPRIHACPRRVMATPGSAAQMPADPVAEIERLRKENAALRSALALQRVDDKELLTAAEAEAPKHPAHPAGQPTEPIRVSAENLLRIEQAGKVEVPKYPRDASGVAKWILHLGLGGFSRSHLAMLTDELLSMQQEQHELESIEGDQPNSSATPPCRWGICGVGLMPWDVKLKDALVSQDHLYTLLTRDSIAGDRASIVGSIMDYIYIPDDPAACLDRLAHPSTAIVSLTVTEKGYCLDASGNLDLRNSSVQHDISSGGLDAPQTALGVIVAALRLRKSRNVPPFTVLSCDNLPMNGSLARRMVVTMAGRIDPCLAQWIASPAVSFPSSMVDRITPVTKQAEMDLLRSEFGVTDAWPVVAEPFIQWVVEDFEERPPWDMCGGVQFVADVKPYELMKLRLLNSSHSALAYIGYLSGHRLVHDAMGDPLVRSFMTRYMASVAPTVPPVPGVNLSEYQATLIRRFSNKEIADTLLRLAQDGSAKWRSTLALGGLAHSALGAMQFAGSDTGMDPPMFTKHVRNADDLAKIQTWRRDHRRWRKLESHGARGEFGADFALLEVARQGEPAPPDVALALAAWVRFMTGEDEAGEPIKLEDPMVATLQPLAKAATKPAGSASALERFLSAALGDSAASWPELTSAVSRWLTAICTRGISCALAEALAESSSLAAVPQVGHGGGVDLAASAGHATAHSRLALLKLRLARLESEAKEVNVQLAIAQAEAEAEEEEVAKALRAGMRRPRSSATLRKLSSPDETKALRGFASCGMSLSKLGQNTPLEGVAGLTRQLSP